MTEYANPAALVTAEWLSAHLDDPSLRIVEVDEDTSAYERGHLPHAVAWHWSRDLHHSVRRDYVTREELSLLLARTGVGPRTTVVLYGGNHNWFAAYAYWLLRYRGFDAVKLLDGGRTKWQRDGRPLVADVSTPAPTDFSIAGRERPAVRAFRDDVLAGLGAAAFVDVRSPQEFTGEKLAPDHLPQEQPYVGGHIPGAYNVPWSTAANEDGTFRSPAELRALYAGAGIAADRPVVTYCRIGERSSHTWFVLHELLGYSNVRNYDGSWTEYGSLVAVPVERGSR